MNTGRKHSEELKAGVGELWTAGKSQREISRALGVSRNSIPGIVRRLGLPKRPQDARSPVRGWQARRTRLALPAAALPPEQIGPIGDFPDAGACRYIAGPVTAQFQCCGHPGYPFCEFHHTRVHIAQVAP